MLLPCLLVGRIFYVVIKHTLNHEIMNFKDKSLFGPLFYLSIATVSLIAITEKTKGDIFFVSHKQLLVDSNFNYLIELYIFWRSIISLVVIRYLGSDQHDRFLVSQITDEQITRYKLFLLILLCSIIFLSLRLTHTIANSVILTCFYPPVSILFIRSGFSYIRTIRISRQLPF
jgi:hypothetical protein